MNLIFQNLFNFGQHISILISHLLKDDVFPKNFVVIFINNSHEIYHGIGQAPTAGEMSEICQMLKLRHVLEVRCLLRRTGFILTLAIQEISSIILETWSNSCSNC